MIVLINLIYHWQIIFFWNKIFSLIFYFKSELFRMCSLFAWNLIFSNVLSCFFISEVFFVFYDIVLRDCKLISMWQLKNISYFKIHENFVLYLLKVIYNYTISVYKLFTQLWLLKCCKSRNFYYVLYSCYMKFYFCYICHIYVICFTIYLLHIYILYVFKFVLHFYFHIIWF